MVLSSDTNSLVSGNSVDLEDLWEFELDVTGAAASPEVLQQILERAPNSESAAAQYLMGFLACHEKK